MSTTNNAKMKTMCLLASIPATSIATGANPLLYTPQTGFSAIVTHLVIRNASGAPNAATVINFGTNSTNYDNWNKGAGGSTAVSLANYTTASGYCLIVFPTAPQETSRRDTCVITSSAPFYMKVGTGAAGVTVTIDLFGYIF